MYLKRLEAYGFKTFAQRTTFEFQSGVTAIVGPNGSGKSNLADAVRWVLGEQSFANLRSKRTDDVIFGGGNGRGPMGFAEVFLTIDNSDRLLPLPYDEVTIGRRAYRNGENEYTINRTRARLRDVLDAVAPLGSSYTLINQGLVDSALALQPEERRRLFEDAAEIGPYQAKKHEAERRLRETETNLIRLSDLVSELEPQLRTLKRQARDAEAVGAVEAELQGLLRRWYAVQWTATTERLSAAETAEQTAAASLSAARTQREALTETLLADRERLRQQRAGLDQQRAALSARDQQYQQIARERAVTAERATGLDQRQAERTQRAAQLATQAEQAEAQAEQAQREATELGATLEQARQRFTTAEQALARELAERRTAEAALAQQRERLIRAAAALEAEQARQQEITRRQSRLEQERDQLSATIEQQRAAVEQRSSAAAAAQAALAAAEQQISADSATLDQRRAALETIRRERDQLDERITAAQRSHGELQARYDALNRLARSYEGAFAGVRAAMQWASREQRPGFALVSTLLRVPAELETAIEVALGARLQHIVVARWADAEAAIAQLKRAGAGRATFLPLDTIKPSRRLHAPQLAGLRGVATELIEVEPEYAPVAAYLLGRTLIADDLAAARRALPELEGGWTIVTLTGEQIATGGAVTGGAATRESGTLRRERELRELPAQLDAARGAVTQLQAARSELHQQLDTAQTAIRQAEGALRTTRAARDEAQRAAETRRREQHRAEDELSGLQRRQQTLEREHAALSEQISRAAQSLAAAGETHAAAQAAADAAEAVLAEQRAAVGNDEATLLELRAAVVQIESEQRRHLAEAQTQTQAARRAADERTALERQTKQTTAELATLAQSLAELEQRQSAAQTQIAEASAELTATQRALTEAERRLEAQEAHERELTAETLAREAAHADAAVDLERQRSERDRLWERAAEDTIDVEQLGAEPPVEEPSASADEPPAALPQRIEQLRTRLRRMGPVNALAPEEYRAAQERHAFLSAQLDDIRTAVATLRDAIGQLDHVMQQQFATTFSAVGQAFSRTFTQLFGGGSARLILLESENGDGTGHGIEIIAQPPGKRQLNLQLLSGGERALTAAALLFAILTVNPSPFCILDEVDAALDEANVVRFREALLELAEQTQFILITHNRGTVEAADTIYGITMDANLGISRVLSLRLQELDETLQLNT
jgi:chromosome segregation protein